MKYNMCGTEIEVYQTESNKYRAYIPGNPKKQAWGNDKGDAVRNLALKYDMPFDLIEMGL
jgi:hypothetical protein